MNSWDSPAFILNELPLRTESAGQKQRHFQYKLHQACSQANISRRFVVWKWDSYMQVGKYFSIVKYFQCSGYGHLCGKRESVEVNWVIRWNVKITRWKWSGTTAGTSSYYHIITILYPPVLLALLQFISLSVKSGQVVSHLLFGVLWYWWRGLCHFNDSNIPGRMKFKTTADGKMWNRKFKSNFLVGQWNKQTQP